MSTGSAAGKETETDRETELANACTPRFILSGEKPPGLKRTPRDHNCSKVRNWIAPQRIGLSLGIKPSLTCAWCTRGSPACYLSERILSPSNGFHCPLRWRISDTSERNL